MGRWLMVISGAVLTVLGISGIVHWWEAVKNLVLAGIVLAILLIGVALIILGIGELTTPAEVPPAATDTEGRPQQPSA